MVLTDFQDTMSTFKFLFKLGVYYSISNQIFNIKITMIGRVVALRENFTDIKVSRLCFKVRLSMESNLQKSHYRLTPLLD